MKFLVEPHDGIFVAAQDDVDETALKEQILQSDVCLSDLDDTDARSPAKKIVYDRLKSLGVIHPSFWSWCARTGYKLLLKGKSAESEAWRDYVELFLGNPDEREKTRRKFTSEEVQRLLYPGVRELYATLPDGMYKSYFTRTIAEVAEIFGHFLGFDVVHHEIFDKEKATTQFVERNSHLKRYFVKGDSDEDTAMLNVLDFYRKHGRIDRIVSCYRADSPYTTNKRFSINVGKNYLGLVEILVK